MEILKQLVVGGVVMGLLDALWLSVVANSFYKSQIGQLLLQKPNMLAAVAFYAIYLVGVIVFVVNPAIEKGSWSHALMYGALFGLVAYATYDLTNLATLKDWPIKLVIVDLLWGMALTSIVAVSTYGVVRTWLS